jgi:hypothetical protein
MNTTIHSPTQFGVRSPRPYFQTTDFDIAAYLHARAYPLLRIDKAGEVAVFSFPAEAALSVEAYYQGATVSAKLLLYAVRQIDYLRENTANEQHCA